MDNTTTQEDNTSLLAINKSMEGRLQEYATLLNSRDNEIAMLQAMLAEAVEHRSKQDTRLTELYELQLYIKELQTQFYTNPFNSSQLSFEQTVDAEQQLSSIQQHHTYLQSQVESMQVQLKELTSRNLLLQSQTLRIGELESLLSSSEIGTGSK